MVYTKVLYLQILGSGQVADINSRRCLVYLKYWTLNLRPLLVCAKALYLQTSVSGTYRVLRLPTSSSCMTSAVLQGCSM